ncbi:MAG: ubiquitin-like domain-containing protein [Lachnospiraceae bacterium]|nr:ubiquitin family protein [Robinsoniella sp.]MDY3767306.1 ubiquitin-like domain-containing protein [Lachnospiraceae bacterium]
MKNKKRILVTVHLSDGEEMDLDVPSEITVLELLEGLNEKLEWKKKTEEIACVYLRSENPIAFLKGDYPLSEYHLRDGSVLFVSFPEENDDDTLCAEGMRAGVSQRK